MLTLLIYTLPFLSIISDNPYAFDGGMPPETLERYLSRSITFMDLLSGAGNVDDNLRMLKNLGAKFAGRTIYRWGSESGIEALCEKAKPIAEKAHALMPDLILQGAVFEIITRDVEKVPIPGWVFEEFGLPVEERCFRYGDMIYPEGPLVNNWSDGASVPDMSRRETQMWFYFASAMYLNVGVEGIHYGQVELMNRRDTDNAGWFEMLGRVRRYAAKHARRHFVLCDAHVPGGGIVRDGKLLLDAHAFPLRIKEVVEKPQEGILEVGFLDSIYRRSAGGITPSGWPCEHLPYLVELDNYGNNGKLDQPSGTLYPWGYDEITWFARQSEEYRNAWLRYAVQWLKEHDPIGYLEMPGSRCLSPSAQNQTWYFANTRSAATPGGFNQEETIKTLWAGTIVEKSETTK